MARLIGFVLLLLLTVATFAGVLSWVPLDWPLWARLTIGIGLALVIPTIVAFWLFSVLSKKEVENKKLRWVLVVVIVAFQGGLLALAIFALDRRPNDFLTAVVALFMEPSEELFDRDLNDLPDGEASADAGTGAGGGIGVAPDAPDPGAAAAPELLVPETPPPAVDDQPRSTQLGLQTYHLWSKRLGDRGFDRVVDAEVTPKGGVVLVGEATPVAEPGQPSPTEGRQLSLALLDQNGLTRWHKKINAAKIEAVDLAVDASGAFYLLGAVIGPVDFGRGPVKIETPHAFLVKFDDAGRYRWLQLIDAPEGAAQRVAVAPGGEIMVAGTFPGKLKVGGRRLESKGPNNLFILKLSPSGEPIWLRQMGESRKRVWAEAFGFYREETVVVGQYLGGGGVGKSALQPLGPDVDERGVFMLRLSQTGKPIATHRLQWGFDQDMGLSVNFDGAGNLVLARGYWGEVLGDGYKFKSTDALDIFLGKFDRDGRHLWSHSYGSTHDQAFPVVTTDRDGRVFMAGSASLGIDLGHGLLSATGTSDVFLSVFSRAGDPKGSRMFANNFRGGAGSLAIDKAGKLIIAGTFSDTMEFGGGPLHADTVETNPQPDIFVAKLSW